MTFKATEQKPRWFYLELQLGQQNVSPHYGQMLKVFSQWQMPPLLGDKTISEALAKSQSVILLC